MSTPTTHTEQFDEHAVDRDPLRQFSRWYEQAERAGILLPMAMTLATATRDGAPSARIVLLKQADERGFVFYTNFRSRKGRELGDNPEAAIVFFWNELDRQVRAEGAIAKVSDEEADRYFATRPRESQIGAHASAQSEEIIGRAALDDDARRLQEMFAGKDVPRPAHWGGYCLRPRVVEFWQGREGRLHDRLVYRRSDAGRWTLSRLAP